MAQTTAATPFHIAGNFRPVRDELTALDLPVTGAIPRTLNGLYVRNGPNARSSSSKHWFLGDGMVHGVRLEEGRARWYRNRFVATKRFGTDAPSIGADGIRDLAAGLANTNVIRHAGRLLALEESSLPYELSDTLTTVGPHDFGGALTGPMTAHPKICPSTGELHFFGYDFAPPYLTYHRADASGALVTSRVVDVPAATMVHDFGLTSRFVVFMDLPAVFDLDLALAGTMPYRFDAARGARLGLLRRDDPHGEIRWFDIEPCYVFHVLNAHDDGRTVTIDVVRHRGLWFEGEATPGQLWRWTIDVSTSAVSETPLDDLPCEFPRVDDRKVSTCARYGWVTTTPRHHPDGVGAITVHDLVQQTSRSHRFGPGRVPSEAAFAPSSDAVDDDGWLLTYVYDASTDTSDLVVLDARAPELDDPVAVIHLPARVPFGFHGSWIADE